MIPASVLRALGVSWIVTMLVDDLDRPRADGRMRDACLAALEQPGTVGDVAARLGWAYNRTRSWVHWLLRHQFIVCVDRVKAPSGQMAGRYQRVTP